MLGLGIGISIGNKAAAAGGGGVSTATLTTGTSTTGAGTNRSHFVNATAYQAVVNAAVGARCLVRAIQSASNSKFQVEVTLAYRSGGSSIYVGFDDGTTDCDSAGGGTISLAQDPGNASGGGAKPGILFELVQGATSQSYAANGTTSTITTAALANTQVMTFDVDTVANTVLVKQNGTTITTITLTSQIPANWYFLCGGFAGNATPGAGSSDSPTVNFGASAWNTSPPGGYSYY